MTRWLSLGKVHRWFAKHRARVILCLDEKNPDCKPTVSWWISLHALSGATDENQHYVCVLQYESLLVSQQREAFDQFIVCLRESSCFGVHFRPLRWLAWMMRPNFARDLLLCYCPMFLI
jgi:hypothetical protein